MKRTDFIRYIQRYRCCLVREGGRHSIYINALSKQTSSIPRHSEIDDFLVKKICKDLGIPKKS